MTRSLSPWLALPIALAVVLASGALYGKYAQRWGPPADLLVAASAVAGLPDRVGAWDRIEDVPMEQSTLEMLECAGYINRKYQHRATGQVINLSVIVGPPGPIAVHTPEICFSSRAYEQQSARTAVELVGREDVRHSFWRLDFKSRNVLAVGLRVYYAWSRGEAWVAAKSPRYEFAAAPGLYKLQLAAPVAPGLESEQTDPGKEFLQDLVNSDWQLQRQAGPDTTEK
jgi:hypothetical protein